MSDAVEIAVLLIICGLTIVVIFSVGIFFKPLKVGHRNKQQTYLENFVFELKYLLLGLSIFYISMMVFKEDFHWNFIKLAVMLTMTFISAGLMASEHDRESYFSPVTSGKGIGFFIIAGFVSFVFLQIVEFGSIPGTISFWNHESQWVVGLFVLFPLSIATIAVGWLVIILP